MAATLKLPVGVEDFKEIRQQGFCYIDKTRLIEQLLDSWGKVNLFTRPRRFGKTLNMEYAPKLTDNEKQRYGALVRMQDGKYAMDEDTLESALQTLQNR
mgnify:FL=1